MYLNKKYDEIKIQGFEVFCNHGLFQEETFLGQKFILDIILYTDTKKAGRSDLMEDSINYGAVCEFVEKEMKSENNKLLERVAERIALGILREFELVRAIDFEIKKPWAPVMRHIDYASVKIYRQKHIAYIGLGSNLGDKRKYLEDAMDAMDALPDTSILKRSSMIETEPYGYKEQDTFMNAIVSIETLLEPLELLHALQAIEQNAGRERKIHWGPRTLDLDILLYDREVLCDPELVVPHPEIEKRMFVLESLCEIAPFEVHPLLNKRFITLKEECE